MVLRADILRKMHDEGSSRWPLVAVGFDAFREHCVKVLGATLDTEAERHGADLYLCCACAVKNRIGMAVMEREGAGVARAAVSRVNREPEFVRETMQMVWDQLLAGAKPKIGTYSGKGPLHGWLRVVATRVALDRCRNQRVSSARHVELMEHLLADLSDPELELLRNRYTMVFQAALQKALDALSLEDRSLLRLHVEERCSIDRIGQMHGIHRATAARWLERIRARVFEGVRAHLGLEAPMTRSEFLSVARAIGTDLELGVMADAGASRSAQELRSHG